MLTMLHRQGPRYVPAMGATGFWHKGTYFCVYRRKESLMNTSGWGTMKDQEEIKISCFGRSIGTHTGAEVALMPCHACSR